MRQNCIKKGGQWGEESTVVEISSFNILYIYEAVVVFPCGLEMLTFSSCYPKFFAVRQIHYPLNQS